MCTHPTKRVFRSRYRGPGENVSGVGTVAEMEAAMPLLWRAGIVVEGGRAMGRASTAVQCFGPVTNGFLLILQFLVVSNFVSVVKNIF